MRAEHARKQYCGLFRRWRNLFKRRDTGDGEDECKKHEEPDGQRRQQGVLHSSLKLHDHSVSSVWSTDSVLAYPPSPART
jgi:hypothetical protein